jgi:dihydrofolate reductase
MVLAAIVATDINNAIGLNNQLLWNLPADLKFFKQTTMGCPIIMGRKTYESIGRLLPGRKNMIVTRNSNYRVEGAYVHSSLEGAINNCREEEKVFIIGGAEIYKQSLDSISELYRTLVKSEFKADTYFPEINPSRFKKVWEEHHQSDEKNKYAYAFEKYVRV